MTMLMAIGLFLLVAIVTDDAGLSFFLTALLYWILL